MTGLWGEYPTRDGKQFQGWDVVRGRSVGRRCWFELLIGQFIWRVSGLDMPANAPGSIVEWLSSLTCIETVRVFRLSRPWNVPAGRVAPSITSMLSSCKLTSPVKSPGCGGVSKSIVILSVMRKSSGSVIAWQEVF